MKTNNQNTLRITLLIFSIWFMNSCSKEEVNIVEETKILHFEFNDSIIDSTQNKYTLKINGNPTLSADRNGFLNQALCLNDTSDYIEIEHHDDLNLQGDFTIAIWIKPNNVKGRYVIHKAFDINGGGPYSLDIFPGTLRSVLSFGENEAEEIRGDKAINTFQWQHIAMTKIGNEVKLYQDGNVVNQTKINKEITTSNSPLYIGTYFWAHASGNVNYTGKIDDFRIYTSGLNKEEIKFIMNE